MQDAMALVRRHGKPGAFVTATTNPNWDEIAANLPPGQTAYDRPDISNRVFALKLKDLLHLLFKCGLLGGVVAHIHVIKFQKRGLPHAHILIIFKRCCVAHRIMTKSHVLSCPISKHIRGSGRPLQHA